MRVLVLRPIILTVAFGALAAASAWSILTGLADYWARQMTLASAEKALALSPQQSAYYSELAVLLADDDPKRSSAALERAIALNPYDSVSWIRLGLNVEGGGDAASAEQYYLHAAEVDHKYLPKWTLANYYLRRGDEAKFWFWAKGAAQVLYGDPLPLFRLCGEVSDDENLIDRLEIRNPDTQAAYLSYLLSENRLDLIGPSTRHLIDRGRESDVPLLLTVCDRLIEAKLPDKALAVWNGLATARKIAYAPLDPNAETILANDNFLPTSVSQGFAWRLPSTPGISASREENPDGLRLVFSGEEPEGCAPLIRNLPVRENSAYDFTVSYRTAGIQPNSGLAWRVRSADGADLTEAPGSLSSENGAQVRMHFHTPSGCRLVRLALEYERALGTTRIEGSIILQGAELERAAQFPENTPGRVMK